MNERSGYATTIVLVIAAIFGASMLPRKAADTAQGETGAAAVHAGKTASAGAQVDHQPISACEQIAKRLDRFYGGTVPMPAGKVCFATAAGSELPGAVPSPMPELRFVIALVADPVQTHLPLVFDRSVEAIQQAVQDSNYSYDESWFPWNISETKYDSVTEEEKAATMAASLQAQPGIMVFRKAYGGESDASSANSGASEASHEYVPYGSGLVVFLVSEQPTGGINDTQFQNALQWMQVLRTSVPKKQLLIVGPTFSGSLPSLARELNAPLFPGTTKSGQLSAFDVYKEGIFVYSGSANSETSLRWFNKYLNGKQGLSKEIDDSESRFRTFNEGDTLMTDRFLCYLRHEGYDLDRVAIISEDETAYGSGGQGGKDADAADGAVHCQADRPDQVSETPKYLYYPRDIATLRSAYEEQSIFSSAKKTDTAAATSLQGNLSEPASAKHDTVRSYSGQLTPLAQEAVLFGLVNRLQAKDIEFTILRGSNSLDQIFLAEFLRRSYPSGRVVIDGSDLLFRRNPQGASLRGVMLLSSYPLLNWTQEGIPALSGNSGEAASTSRSASYRVFPEDFIEGIYVATRMLLRNGAEAKSNVPISDYGTPRSHATNSNANSDSNKDEKGRPATWVTVVGHGQFWAIAMLNDSTETEEEQKFGPAPQSILVPEAGSAKPRSGGAGGRRRGLPDEMAGLLAACALLGLWHLYGCWNGSILRPPRMRAYFAPIPKVQHTILIFLGSLIVSFVAVTLYFVLLPGWRSSSDVVRVFAMILPVLTIAGSGCLGCLANYRLPIVTGGAVPRDEALVRKWRKILRLAFVPTLAVIAILRYTFLTQRLNASNFFPLFWRNVHLRSGVSPLLPQILLLTGLYCWFWFNLRGLSLFGDDRPVLPSIKDFHPALKDNPAKAGPKFFLMFSREGAGQNIERNAIPLSANYWVPLAVFFGISFLSTAVALGGWSLRSLGDRRYGLLIFLGVTLCMALILADIWQMLSTWSQLQRLLNFLDRLRLRRAFTGLRGMLGGSVWALSGNVLGERYRLISRQLEALGNLKNAIANAKGEDEQEVSRRKNLITRIELAEKKRDQFVEWYIKLLDDDCKDADKLYRIDKLTEWQEELAALVAYVMREILLPAWRTESRSVLGDLDTEAKEGPHVEAGDYLQEAEQFVVLPYLGFIQNILGRLRTLGLSAGAVFLAMTLAISSYPFDPMPSIAAVFLILFAVAGAVSAFVYAEMSRDATLSRITDKNPGELGGAFWMKLATFGLPPLIGLLTTLFPSMADFIGSVLQPGAQALR
jgi:hypothetical protein